MTYLQSKKILAFFAAFFLFFIFEGSIPFLAFLGRSERDFNAENKILYEKIAGLEKQIFNLQKTPAVNTISANIIFGGGYIFSDSIFLDKGAEDGVRVGDLVVFESSFAIASIEEVYNKHSKAALFSRFGAKTPFRSGVEKNILFDAEGRGGEEMFSLLPKGSGIDVGNGVYLGQNSKFIVGIVEEVGKKEGRDFEEIKILLPFSLRSIVDVEIIKYEIEQR